MAGFCQTRPIRFVCLFLCLFAFLFLWTADVIDIFYNPYKSGWGHFCGGTILDATTVMCAAHCFTKDQSMSGYYVAAGMTDRKDNNAQKIEIANGVWNAEMPYSGNNNDFVILKLKSAFTFNDKVGAACLPEPSHAPDATGQTCFVSGWGTLESGILKMYSFPNSRTRNNLEYRMLSLKEVDIFQRQGFVFQTGSKNFKNYFSFRCQRLAR